MLVAKWTFGAASSPKVSYEIHSLLANGVWLARVHRELISEFALFFHSSSITVNETNGWSVCQVARIQLSHSNNWHVTRNNIHMVSGMFHKYDKQDVENPCVPNSYPIAQSQLSWSTYQNSKYKLLMLLGKLDKKVLIHGHHDKTSCVTASVQNLVSKCAVTCSALLLKAAVHTLNRLLICCDESTVA